MQQFTKITLALSVFLFFLCGTSSVAQNNFKPTRADSLKGSITPERAWWDVQRYDLDLEIDLAQKDRWKKYHHL